MLGLHVINFLSFKLYSTQFAFIIILLHCFKKTKQPSCFCFCFSTAQHSTAYSTNVTVPTGEYLLTKIILKGERERERERKRDRRRIQETHQNHIHIQIQKSKLYIYILIVNSKSQFQIPRIIHIIHINSHSHNAKT